MPQTQPSHVAFDLDSLQALRILPAPRHGLGRTPEQIVADGKQRLLLDTPAAPPD